MNRLFQSAPRYRRLSRTAGSLLCACLILSPLALVAQPADTNRGTQPSILDRSPFLPPDFQPPSQRSQQRRPKPAEQTSYEFRGVYQLAGEYRFLIAEARAKEGDWVSLQRPGDYQIKHYDPQTQVLTILANNEEEQLELARLNPDSKPMPVEGQSSAEDNRRQASAQPADSSNSSPRRRVIRPTSRSSSSGNSDDSDDANASGNSNQTQPPTPAWLQQLRERAAQRREAAREAREQNEP